MIGMANERSKMTRYRVAIKAGLLIFGAGQLAIGLWALLTPADWFRDFPSPGEGWLELYGGYNEHNVRDLGATFVALGFLLIAAAASMQRLLVQVALATFVVFQFPHLVYHLAADDQLPGAGQVLNGLMVSLAVIGPLALLFLTRRSAIGASLRRSRPGGGPGSPPGPPGDGWAARIEPPRRGLLRRALGWYMRRRFGEELTPLALYAHSPRLLLGYGAFESAFERAGRLDDRLKALAELKAAALVRCEWCMDFGSSIGRETGLSEVQLRELSRYRESAAFTETEKLVLDYATAMTCTPAAVDDELVELLRAEFSDEQLLELTIAAAIENYRARATSALGIRAQGFSEGASCIRPERGADAPAALRPRPGPSE